LPVERRRQVVGELVAGGGQRSVDFDAIFLDTLGDQDAEVRATSVAALEHRARRDPRPAPAVER
jgi:hypothetical protein